MLKKLTTAERIEKAYSYRILESQAPQFVLDRFDRELRHTYSKKRLNSEGAEIPLEEVYDLVKAARDKVSSWYEEKTKEPLPADRPPKTELVSELRTKLYQQEDFRKALEIIAGKGSFDELQRIGALPKQPWHNEMTTGEISFDYGFHKNTFVDSMSSPDFYTVGLVPAHSLEMQLNREGFVVPVRPVSTDGIILATADRESKKGYIVFGIRGGGSYPNTYHTVAAGGLGISDALKAGKETIKDAFIKRELVPELGEGLNNIDDNNIKSIGRVEDWILGMGSSTYVFEVPTNLSKEELSKSWGAARDKQEHQKLIFIPNNFESIREFMRNNYRGFVENRPNRKNDERFLLHPGAMDLALYLRNNGFNQIPLAAELEKLQQKHGKEKEFW